MASRERWRSNDKLRTVRTSRGSRRRRRVSTRCKTQRIAGQQVGFARLDLLLRDAGQQCQQRHAARDRQAIVFCCEGFFLIDGNRPSRRRKMSRSHLPHAGPAGYVVTGALFANEQRWRDPVAGQYNPRMVVHDGYVQGAPATIGPGTNIMYTNDAGATWRQIATIPYELRDLPHVTESSIGAVLYQSDSDR